jgi:hypothetical protein
MSRPPNAESASAPTAGHSCSSGASTSQGLRLSPSVLLTVTRTCGPRAMSSSRRRHLGTRSRTHYPSSRFIRVSNQLTTRLLYNGVYSLRGTSPFRAALHLFSRLRSPILWSRAEWFSAIFFATLNILRHDNDSSSKRHACRAISRCVARE